MKKLGYKIIGKKCGRDKKGEFHCQCGKCRPLTQSRPQIKPKG